MLRSKKIDQRNHHDQFAHEERNFGELFLWVYSNLQPRVKYTLSQKIGAGKKTLELSENDKLKTRRKSGLRF